MFIQDPDKRKFRLLQILNNTEEQTDYYEKLDLECVETCPSDYHRYNSSNFCVGDVEEFNNFEKGCKSTKISSTTSPTSKLEKAPQAPESQSNYTIIIITCLASLAIIIGGFFGYKNIEKLKVCCRNGSNEDKKEPGIHLSMINDGNETNRSPLSP